MEAPTLTEPTPVTEMPDDIAATEELVKGLTIEEPAHTHQEEFVEDYGVAPKLNPSSGTLTGVVKFFNRGKGFGFITPDNGAEDLFVHSTGVTGKTLMDDDKVSFTVAEQDDGRLNAENVTGGTGNDDDRGFGGSGYRRGGRDNDSGGYRGGGSSGGSRECFNFRDSGHCRYGDECRFSHGDSNGSGSGFSAPPRRDNGGRFGRPSGGSGYGDNDRGSSGGYARRDNYGDNSGSGFSGGRGGGVCYSFRDYGNCRHGDDCKFSHE